MGLLGGVYAGPPESGDWDRELRSARVCVSVCGDGDGVCGF